MNDNQEKNDRPVIQQTNNYYAPIGQQINHVDKIEAHFDKDMGIQVDGHDIIPEATASPDGVTGVSSDAEWIGEITSCFFGIKENALEFVRLARCLKPKQITELVNAWLVKKKISDKSFNRDLYMPLHEHGVYRCSESNWNDQVHLPR